MNKIAEDFKDKGVEVYTVYTREPHPGQKMRGPEGMDFTDRKQTKTHQERVDYAKILIDDHDLKVSILIDEFTEDNVQNTLGGKAPNSLLVIDRKGKAALWQGWTNPEELRVKLAKMTGGKK